MDLSVSVCAGGVIFLDCAPRTAVRISNCLHLVSLRPDHILHRACALQYPILHPRPDPPICDPIRYLEAEEYGDEWYVERFQLGYTQNGITKMPAFGDLLGQKAAWAIRTYIETRHDDGALDEYSDRLKTIRDQLNAWSGGETAEIIAELRDIAGKIETASGAPVADSVAFRAANLIDRDAPDFHEAANQLTIGLSAAE